MDYTDSSDYEYNNVEHEREKKWNDKEGCDCKDRINDSNCRQRDCNCKDCDRFCRGATGATVPFLKGRFFLFKFKLYILLNCRFMA